MTTIDEVYPVDLRATVGPMGTIKRLFLNRDYFQQRGYDMTIFANHFTHRRGLCNYYEMREISELPLVSNIHTQDNKNNRIIHCISKIKQWAQDNKWVAHLLLKYEAKREEKHIDQYIAKGRRPDIVVFHDFYGCHYYLTHRHSNDYAKVALFLESDGKDIDQMYSKYPKLVGTKAFKRLYNFFIYDIEHIDRLVFISRIAVEAFLKRHPEYNKNKISTAVNGVEYLPIEQSVPSCRFKYRLCTSGTVCQRKGQYIIVEAMKRMSKEILKDTHLTIMGLGPDYAKLVNDVQNEGLTEHIIFLGNVPNSEMHSKLCEENIYCLMSNNEGLPIAIIEAMRAGLPVISTNVAGIPETVDERNGILINPDIKQLTDLLNRLPEYDWESLGKASRKRFEEEFTFQRMLNDYANMFDSMKIERK